MISKKYEENIQYSNSVNNDFDARNTRFVRYTDKAVFFKKNMRKEFCDVNETVRGKT